MSRASLAVPGVFFICAGALIFASLQPATHDHWLGWLAAAAYVFAGVDMLRIEWQDRRRP